MVLRHLRRLATVFSHDLGALLMAFGALLVGIGIAVRLAREYEVTRAESTRGAPAFEALLPGAEMSGLAATPGGASRSALVGESTHLATAGPTRAMDRAMAPLGRPGAGAERRMAALPHGEALRLVDAPPFDGEVVPAKSVAASRPPSRAHARPEVFIGPSQQPTPHGTAQPIAPAEAREPREFVPVWDPLPATQTPDQFAGMGEVPTRLVIPRIQLDTPVVVVGWQARVVNGEQQGNEWQTAENAAGFHRSTALPGHVGNTVISGHNNIAGAVFRDLHRLRLGDEIHLYTRLRRFDYVVAANFIVEEAGVSIEQRRANAQWIGPTADERLTLITCFPPWGNSHRTIVIAKPVGNAAARTP